MSVVYSLGDFSSVDFLRVGIVSVINPSLGAIRSEDYTAAQHIVGLDLYDRLQIGDASLVPDLGKMRFRNKDRYVLSFATKYCSWHKPDLFQIFDSYVEWILWQYKKLCSFASFKRYELRVYPQFVSIVAQFVNHFGLAQLSRKDLDRFLWSEGKDNWR